MQVFDQCKKCYWYFTKKCNISKRRYCIKSNEWILFKESKIKCTICSKEYYGHYKRLICDKCAVIRKRHHSYVRDIALIEKKKKTPHADGKFIRIVGNDWFEVIYEGGKIISKEECIWEENTL